MVVRWKIWALFLISLFILSYLREVTFMSINAIINGETQFYAKTTEILILQEYSPNTLRKLKIVLTCLFSLLFILFSSLGLKLSFKQKYPYQITLFIYGMLTLVAFFILLSNFFNITFQTIYPILRKLIGWIHNPIIYISISIAGFSIESVRKTEN